MGLLDEARQKKSAPQPIGGGLLAEARELKQAAPIEQESVIEEQAETPQSFEEQFLNIPAMKPLSELAAAANKSVFQFLDFLGPDNVNAVLELVGSDKQVPTLSDNLASDGGYMEEGMARDAVQMTGQLLPMAAGMSPVAGRNIATAKGATQEILGLGSAKVAEPLKAATQTVSNAVSDALPSKAKEAAKLPLYRNSGDIVTAGFKLDDAGKVVKDAAQKKALKAGLDEGLGANDCLVKQGDKVTNKRDGRSA